MEENVWSFWITSQRGWASNIDNRVFSGRRNTRWQCLVATTAWKQQKLTWTHKKQRLFSSKLAPFSILPCLCQPYTTTHYYQNETMRHHQRIDVEKSTAPLHKAGDRCNSPASPSSPQPPSWLVSNQKHALHWLSYTPEDVNKIFMEDDETHFHNLQKSLRSRGCVTNTFLKQKMHQFIYVKNKQHYGKNWWPWKNHRKRRALDEISHYEKIIGGAT